MASVQKDLRGRSPFWYGCYVTAEGKRRMVSTKVRVKEDPRGKKAQAICDAWQSAEEGRVAGTITKSRVEEILNQTLRSVGLSPMETPRVGKWLDDWLAGKRNISEASRLGYDQAVREFKEWLGHRVNQPLEAVTESDIDAFVNHLLKDHRSASTVNKLVRKYLSGAFEKARKLGKIKYNPVAATDSLPSDSTVKDPFSPTDVARLVKVAEGDWKGAILLAYGTGARLQDVCNFRWDAIDTVDGVVTFRERKTKREAVVGIHPDFLDWVSKRQSVPEQPDAYLFPTLANRSGAGRNGLSKQFDALMTRAGVAGRILREKKGKGRTVRSLTFHSFRHTAASSIFNSEAIKDIQRRVTNHARGGVIDRYTHADLDLIKQAVTLIPRLPKDE
jgi:integrase